MFVLQCRGPLMGRLKAGETVTLDDGAVVSTVLIIYDQRQVKVVKYKWNFDIFHQGYKWREVNIL